MIRILELSNNLIVLLIVCCLLLYSIYMYLKTTDNLNQCGATSIMLLGWTMVFFGISIIGCALFGINNLSAKFFITSICILLFAFAIKAIIRHTVDTNNFLFYENLLSCSWIISRIIEVVI